MAVVTDSKEKVAVATDSKEKVAVVTDSKEKVAVVTDSKEKVAVVTESREKEAVVTVTWLREATAPIADVEHEVVGVPNEDLMAWHCAGGRVGHSTPQGALHHAGHGGIQNKHH